MSICVHPWLKYFSLRLRVSAVILATTHCLCALCVPCGSSVFFHLRRGQPNSIVLVVFDCGMKWRASLSFCSLCIPCGQIRANSRNSRQPCFLSASIRVHPWLKYFFSAPPRLGGHFSRNPLSLCSLRSLRFISLFFHLGQPMSKVPCYSCGKKYE